MTTCGNIKGLDEHGQEVLWSSRGQQVMMRWEKPYMELCADALAIRSTDRVLEIGFGLAYSASRIQSFRPRSHTIIECDRETLQRAQQFAARYKGVKIVPGTWQMLLPTLDQFDCVFFDDYPLPELEARDLSANGEGIVRQRSRWHEFLDVVLAHCATGARISGYLAREVDLQRPGCQVSVSKVEVDVPEHCNYFPHRTALVPVITVIDPIVAAGADPSKKLECTFDSEGRSERTLRVDKKFRRERRQIAEIREFLLAQEAHVLSDQRSAEYDRDDKSVMDEEGSSAREDKVYGDWQDDKWSKHYNDETSRRDFLRQLRRRAAVSKEVFA